MLPIVKNKVKCQSYGWLTDAAAIARGPVLAATVENLLKSTVWGKLD